jgi:GT2 family glycosyltransferase
MRVSVIIPTASRPQRLSRLISQLRRQHLEGDMEIIVVDDAGDLDADILRAAGGQCEVCLMKGGRRGPACARNAGALEATGQNLVFLDDDSEIDAGYLSRVLRELECRPNHAVAGPQCAVDGAGSFALASAWLLDHFSRSQRLDEEDYTFAPSNGLALRRSAFQGMDGFDIRFPLAAGEDREFCERWVASGRRIAILSQLAVHHHFPSTARAFWAQQWRYGRGAAFLSGRTRSAAHLRSTSFYARLLWSPVENLGWQKGIRIALASAIAQVVVLLGFAYQRSLGAPC